MLLKGTEKRAIQAHGATQAHGGASTGVSSHIKDLVSRHPCAGHALFSYLRTESLSAPQAVALLVNYDAHASLLRRLLLKAATIMPEPAVGFVLENVRNEYGNGDYSLCHQRQLRDLIARLQLNGGRSYGDITIADGVRQYMLNIGRFYCPTAAERSRVPKLHGGNAAIAAGAITATELMAVEEFKAMQTAFRVFGLAEHPWFDHVSIECDHGKQSLALAEYFLRNCDANAAIHHGFTSTLETNQFLYDGLLQALTSSTRATQPPALNEPAEKSQDRGSNREALCLLKKPNST